MSAIGTAMRVRSQGGGASGLDVLFVTSVSPDLYRASGRRLIRAFLREGVEGTLLCCHEGSLGSVIVPRPPRLATCDLDRDRFLARWLQCHRAIIPRHLGGTAGPCACPQPENPFAPDHRPGCTGQWFNKNASRWFRKIASLRHALTLDPGVIVWVDADCRFRRRLTAARLERCFDGHGVFYLQSPDRRIPETGVMGFHLARGGRRFLEALIARYESGRFRRDPRWDDSAQFHFTRQTLRRIRAIDLATRASGDAHVLRHSPLGRYLEHDKGRHGPARLGLMR